MGAGNCVSELARNRYPIRAGPRCQTRACAAWGIGVAAERLPSTLEKPVVDALAEAIHDKDGFVRFWVVDAGPGACGQQSFTVGAAGLPALRGQTTFSGGGHAAQIKGNIGEEDSGRPDVSVLTF